MGSGFGEEDQSEGFHGGGLYQMAPPSLEGGSIEKTAAMDCQTCNDLVAAYEDAVKLYLEAIQDMAELVEDDPNIGAESISRNSIP